MAENRFRHSYDEPWFATITAATLNIETRENLTANAVGNGWLWYQINVLGLQGRSRIDPIVIELFSGLNFRVPKNPRAFLSFDKVQMTGKMKDEGEEDFQRNYETATS